MLNELMIIGAVLLASYCAYIYSQEWTKAGQILNPVYLWSENAFPEWIHKPFIGCFRCVCAHWAMWTYFILTLVCHASNFNIFLMFACACAGTGVGIILNNLLNDE